MLADSPQSYDVAAAEVAAHGAEWWDAFAGDSAAGPAGTAGAVDRRTVVLAEVDGQAVGMVAAHVDGATAHVGALWVEPAWRGRGIATALLDAVGTWAHDVRAERLELGVAEGNEAARLYCALGFEATGERRATRWGIAEVVMAKPVGC